MTRDERMNLNRCRNETQRNHIRYIEQWGVSIISVSPKVGEDSPFWTYSIGFWQEYEHPEMLIIGLDGSTAGALINEMNRRIRDKGRRFDAGSSSGDLLSGDYVCYFELVDPTEYGEWLVANEWFYGDRAFKVVQMLWPDMNHVYPWQQAASSSFRQMQPILSSLPKSALQ